MTRPLARFLIGLYPLSWKARYGAEFEAFLIQENAGIREVVDVMCCAFREHLLLLGEFRMTNLQRSIVWMAYSCLAAILAGMNLWWTVDDTPLVHAMQEHQLLSVSWSAVEAGSLIMLIAALVGGLSALFAILQFVRTQQRYGILIRLALPPFITAVLVIWVTVIGLKLHWLPTPWDVTGDWIAPSFWPTLPLRWELSTVTAILLAAAVLGTAISVRGAIRRSALSEIELVLPWWSARIGLSTLTEVAAFALAASMLLMLAGTTVWGFFSQQYDPVTFHSRAGGFFGVRFSLSWAGSVALFLAAAVTGLRAAHFGLHPADAATRA
jgi:hypothetical protein